MLPEILSTKGLLASGIYPDLHVDGDFLWVDSRNVVSTPVGVKKMKGWTSTLTPPSTQRVCGLEQQLVQDGTKYLHWGNPTQLYSWDGVNIVDRSQLPYRGRVDQGGTSYATHWSFALWGDWVLASNGVDPIQIWRKNVDTHYRNLTSLGDGEAPATAVILEKMGPHVIAFNTSSGPTAYEWCTADDPTTWLPATTNSAGGNIIRDFSSPIRAAVRCGDRIAIYGDNEVAIMSYLGSPLYFGVGKPLSGVGAWSQKSVVSADRKNFGWGPGGIFVTDGVSYKYLDVGVIATTLRADLNMAQASKIVGYQKLDTTEVVWYYPSGSSTENNKGLSYNYTTNTFHFLDHGRTAATTQRIFTNGFTAGTSGNIYTEGSGVDAAGSAITSYVQTKALDFGDRAAVKYLESIIASVKDFAGYLQVYVGFKMRLDDDWEWTMLQLEPGDQPIQYFGGSARWFCIKFQSSAVGDYWDLQNFVLTGEACGF